MPLIKQVASYWKTKNQSCRNAIQEILELTAGVFENADVDKHAALEAKQSLKDYLSSVAPHSRAASMLGAARQMLLQNEKPEYAHHPMVNHVAATVVAGLEKISELSQGDDYACVVARFHDNGLFANVLQVLDMLVLAKPDAPVLVDWQRQGTEGHFQYGPVGSDLFTHLFEHCDRCQSLNGRPIPARALELQQRVNPLFKNYLRGFAWAIPKGDFFSLQCSYTEAARSLLPSPLIQQRVREVTSKWPRGAQIIGVHKRLSTREVGFCQLSQRAPDTEEFLEAVWHLLRRSSGEIQQVIFLATDDALAAKAFEEAFGNHPRAMLCCRADVKRTDGGVRADGVDNEVHRSPCELKDAEDALVDALCLRQCHQLVCIDSNLSLFVALTSASVEVHPLNSYLPSGWEEETYLPAMPVYSTYEVVHRPAVMISERPCTASAVVNLKRTGEIVEATGRAWKDWIELEEGGWIPLGGSEGWVCYNDLNDIRRPPAAQLKNAMDDCCILLRPLGTLLSQDAKIPRLSFECIPAETRRRTAARHYSELHAPCRKNWARRQRRRGCQQTLRQCSTISLTLASNQ